MKILVVEDDHDMRDIIRTALEKELYTVSEAEMLNDAKQKIEDYRYDCILLDIMLPDGSGLDLLQWIKDQGRKENVIILSAKDSIDDRVAGLNQGADDYLPKPFHLAELKARIHSVIRRNNNNGNLLITFGNVSIDDQEKIACINGTPLELKRKEYELLHYFITRKEHIIKKETIAEDVWGDHFDQVDNYDFLYAQIKNLRKKLVASQADIELKAIYGFGYKLTQSEE